MLLYVVVKYEQIACGCPIFEFFFFFFSKLAARALDILAGVRLDFFHAMDFGAQNIAKKRNMKCTFC